MVESEVEEAVESEAPSALREGWMVVSSVRPGVWEKNSSLLVWAGWRMAAANPAWVGLRHCTAERLHSLYQLETRTSRPRRSHPTPLPHKPPQTPKPPLLPVILLYATQNPLQISVVLRIIIARFVTLGQR